MYPLITVSPRPIIETKYPRPEVLFHVVALALHERPSDVDRALFLDVPDYLKTRVLRRNRQPQGHAVKHQVFFLCLTFLCTASDRNCQTTIALPK